MPKRWTVLHRQDNASGVASLVVKQLRFRAIKTKAENKNEHLLTEAYLREIGIPLGPALKIMDALRGSIPTLGGSPLASWPLPPSVDLKSSSLFHSVRFCCLMLEGPSTLRRSRSTV